MNFAEILSSVAVSMKTRRSQMGKKECDLSFTNSWRKQIGYSTFVFSKLFPVSNSSQSQVNVPLL